MDRRINKGQITRQHILGVATELFKRQGFDAVSIDAILAECGISKGALYHHFDSKSAVFIAVLEQVEDRIAKGLLAAAAQAATPRQMLEAGCSAWLKLAAEDDEVRQIVLLEAPSAIGWQAWRAIDERYSLGLLRAGLVACSQQGLIPPSRVPLFANALLAVLIEVSLLIARAPEDAATAEAGRDAVERVLKSLLGN